jgi:hypothetical protein
MSPVGAAEGAETWQTDCTTAIGRWGGPIKDEPACWVRIANDSSLLDRLCCMGGQCLQQHDRIPRRRCRRRRRAGRLGFRRRSRPRAGCDNLFRLRRRHLYPGPVVLPHPQRISPSRRRQGAVDVSLRTFLAVVQRARLLVCFGQPGRHVLFAQFLRTSSLGRPDRTLRPDIAASAISERDACV